MSTMLMPLQFHVSSCSVSSSLSVVIQNTSTILQALLVIYCFEHITFLHCSQNCLLFCPPRLFILHFRIVLFLCPAFFLLCLSQRDFLPLYSIPSQHIITCTALPSSVSSSSGQWRTGFIALITPQRSLRLFSSYLPTTAAPSFPMLCSSSRSPFFAGSFCTLTVHILSCLAFSHLVCH